MNGAVFLRAWRLLAQNLSIVVPGLVVGAVAAILETIFAGAPASDGADTFTWLALDVTQIVAAILTISYTTGMADAAWRAGRARLRDGTRAFRHDGVHVAVAILALLVLGFVAALAAPYTFALSILAYGYFGIYTMAAAVVGERRGVAAVIESARIAAARPLSTAIMVAGIAVVAGLTGFLAIGSAGLPFLGPLISDLVVQLVVAYVVLVVVGEYRVLRDLEVSR